MGGWGSGRQGGRPIADSALFVEIAYMVRTGRAVPRSLVRGTLSWTCRGEPSGNINYTCDMTHLEHARLELNFTVSDRFTDEKRHYNQHIRLSYTEPHFGGKRWWMHCPHNGSRVGKLYCPAGADTFASRTAWRLGYQSQRENKRDRAFTKLHDLQRKLGGEAGYGGYLRRPKGMWWRTWTRHLARFREIEAECDREMGLMAAKLMGYDPEMAKRLVR